MKLGSLQGLVRRRRVKAKNRKDKVEQVLKQARKISSDSNETRQAWCRIIRELEFMCDPEAKMPRFNTLLHAVWIAATGDQT